MTRFLSGLSLLLFHWSAHAQAAAADVPEETASPLGIIIFAVLFVGFCVGFIWMVYAKDRKSRRDNQQSGDASGKAS